VEAGHGHGQGDDEDDEDVDGHEAQETMGLEDLLRVIHLLSSAPRTTNLRSQQRRQQEQGHLPGGYPAGTGTAATSPFSLFNALQGTRSGSGSATSARTPGTTILDDEDEEMLEVVQDTDPSQPPQGAPTSIARYVADHKKRKKHQGVDEKEKKRED